MDDILKQVFKSYLQIFTKEYIQYLDKEQLEKLKNINIDKILKISKTTNPIGDISLGNINLPIDIKSLINSLKQMPEYGKKQNTNSNKNFTSYIKNICELGYDDMSYYADILIYLLFKLLIKNNSALTLGLINKEIIYLSNKYRIIFPNIYKREEFIARKFINLIGDETARSILFKGKTASYKYLNDSIGYKYAELYLNLSNLMDDVYNPITQKEYNGFEGILEYAKDYDTILYGNVYNVLLDFEVKNM